ncbi:Gfo/Idh/MocA family oxidoreductase [Brevibacillus ruminantium]|uniref:Gfo/Idh/MocA family oxidoreductase n=1 Tax=Brevibacillus ruminantium TaxID=2950604 RepID=A0ABY4WJ70_9BACL|nr:Gfo/Idh/MocA family oxidoreductase [Brevibacillus ruminantium]USG67132.1 Gfo/Idh/MocA family oxidoreductase [Brevibacillus ruminantium]
MKKAAVLGAGRWGQHWVRTLHRLEALDSVADLSSSIRERVVTAYPQLPVYESYEEIWGSKAEAVVIATPAHTHYAMAKAAILSGKDVLVEKPLTLSVRHAQELVRLAKAHRRILMVGHLLLYQPAMQWIQAYLSSGELGELYSLHLRRAQLGTIRSVENAMWSLGVHDIAVILSLIGKSPTMLRSESQSIFQRGIEDDVHLHLSFSGGQQAHLHTTWLWPQKERRMVIIGSRGMLEFEELTQTVKLHRKGFSEDLACLDDGSEIVFSGTGEPLQSEALHFLECIETRQVPWSDGEQGVAVVRVLEEATRMMKEGSRR